MAVALDRPWPVLGLIVVLTVLGGVAGTTPTTVGEGSATIAVETPTTDRLVTEPGRFGTAATYLRLPDLVADVTNATGRPRLVYAVRVPALDLDRQRTRLIRGEGRIRVRMADRAYPPRASDDPGLPEPGTYDGRLVVRVQSASHDRTVVNRSIRVRVGV